MSKISRSRPGTIHLGDYRTRKALCGAALKQPIAVDGWMNTYLWQICIECLEVLR